jgi:hypothetical protein
MSEEGGTNRHGRTTGSLEEGDIRATDENRLSLSDQLIAHPPPPPPPCNVCSSLRPGQGVIVLVLLLEIEKPATVRGWGVIFASQPIQKIFRDL